MPNYRVEARRAAQRHGLDPDVFEAQIGVESNFNPRARSGAGATGIAQIMPATARSWGVNPNDPIASLDAAAKNMAAYVRKYGSYENALRAYNAGPNAIQASRGYSETNNYVAKILGGREPGKLRAPSSGGGEAAATSSTGQSDGQQLAALVLAQGLQQPEQPRPSMGLTAPSFAAGPVAARGAQQVVSQAQPRESPGATLAQALAAVKGLGAAEGAAPAQDDGSSAEPAVGRSGAQGRVQITGPNPGRIQSDVRSFLEQVSRVRGGKPVVGSDGTGHSLYTVNGRVSEHSTGNAVDVPARGAELIALGQAALIAAGMPRAQARRQRGGLFNLTRGGRRIQIIFNTQEGGDHTDHLHAGVSRVRR